MNIIDIFKNILIIFILLLYVNDLNKRSLAINNLGHT